MLRPQPAAVAERVDPPDQAAGGSGLLTNVGALMASRLAIAALGWIGTVLIVRALSVDDFGRFTFIFSVLGLLSIVTDMGIGRVALAGMLNTSGDRAAFAGSYLLLRCLMGVLGYLVAVAFVSAAGYSADVVRATAVAGVAVVLSTPAHAYATVFQAHRRMRGVSAVEVLGRVAQLALTAAIAAAGGSVLLFTLPAVLAELVVLVAIIPMAHRLVTFRYRIDVASWWALLREAAPLSVGAALATIYYRVDSIMLSKLDGFEAVGIYGVAYKFADLAHFVSTAVTVAILPLLVAAWPGRPEALRFSLRRGGTILALVGGWIIVEFTLFAGQLITSLYGAAYAGGADAARIVVGSGVLAYFTSLALITLVAVGRHGRYPLIALVGLLINLGLNLVLIPEYSYLGAALATLTTDVVVVGWMCWEVRRVDGLRPLPRPPIMRILIVLAVSAGSGAAMSALLPWPLAAVLVAGVYVGAVVVLRAAGPDGLRALRREADKP